MCSDGSSPSKAREVVGISALRCQQIQGHLLPVIEGESHAHGSLGTDTPVLGAKGCVHRNPKEKPEDSSLALSQALQPANAVLCLS